MVTVDTDLRSALEAAWQEALQHLETLDRGSVSSTTNLATLRRRIARPLVDEGMAPEEVVRDLARDVEGGILGSAGGRFFGWVIGGCLPAALAADWLASAWDQNGALYSTAPAAAVVEEVAGQWVKEILGLPASASFALVTGCQMAHTTCLAVARHALLAARNWDVEEQGLGGAPAIRILSSGQQHGSIERSLRLLGLGRNSIMHLPADGQDRLPTDALRQAFESDPSTPTIVLLQAGDINIGACDSFEELIPLAHRYGAWVHVDGAFGLWAAASPQYRRLVRGVEHADSWATDGHKWLNVPFDCGYAIVADANVHRAAMSHQAAYVTHDSEARDPMDWNPEWSRRARGFPTYAALRQLGRRGVARLVEDCCGHARSLVMRLGALPGVEILWEPSINQGLVCFPDPHGASQADHDRRTDRVIAAILETGEAFFSGTTWRGIRAMRISVCNWRTCEADVDRAVAAVSQVLTGPV